MLHYLEDFSGHPLAAAGDIGHPNKISFEAKNRSNWNLGVETVHWYSGREILIAPGRVATISYEDSRMFVNFAPADIGRAGEKAAAKAVA